MLEELLGGGVLRLHQTVLGVLSSLAIEEVFLSAISLTVLVVSARGQGQLTFQVLLVLTCLRSITISSISITGTLSLEVPLGFIL